MTKKVHIHKWVRRERGTWRKARYQCDDPHCYAVKTPPYLLGKVSRCTQCDNEFILTRDQLENARPRCLRCAGTEEARKFQAMEQMVKNAVAVEDVEKMEDFTL